MRALVLGLSLASLLVMGAGAMQAGLTYPLSMTLDATLTNGATTITSKVTIQVSKQMADSARTRVTDALQHGGYPNFLNMLRPLPSVGSIETQSGSVPVRYTRAEPVGAATRLVLVADRPLFFLNRDESKSRAGYELTVVNLSIDGQGGVTGQMAAAARVKPSPAGVLLDDYADALVQLRGRISRP